MLHHTKQAFSKGGMILTIPVQLKIKSLRETARLTQRDLAKRVGVNHATVCKWERGSIYPESWRVPLIADALSCTTDALYGRDGTKKRSVS